MMRFKKNASRFSLRRLIPEGEGLGLVIGEGGFGGDVALADEACGGADGTVGRTGNGNVFCDIAFRKIEFLLDGGECVDGEELFDGSLFICPGVLRFEQLLNEILRFLMEDFADFQF